METKALLDRFGRSFAAGTVLFREGDVGREMYVIHSGKVRITREIQGRTTVLAVLPPGEFFGEMALINNKPRSARATVVEDAELLVLDSKTFSAMIRASSDIAVRMIQKLAQRVQMANTQIEILLVQEPNHRVVFTLRQMAQQVGRPEGPGVKVPVRLADLAGRVALPEEEVESIISKLKQARLLVVSDDGFLIPEVGRLEEYLEFLEMRRQYGSKIG